MDSSRLPPVCPASRESSRVGSRDSRIRRASRSLRDKANAHLSTSPGGNTPSSSRSCPELPPLSNIVTIPCSSTHGFRLSPDSTLGSPVPPPRHPTLIVRSCIGRFYQEP